jgi:hypothetical protein
MPTFANFGCYVASNGQLRAGSFNVSSVTHFATGYYQIWLINPIPIWTPIHVTTLDNNQYPAAQTAPIYNGLTSDNINFVALEIHTYNAAGAPADHEFSATAPLFDPYGTSPIFPSGLNNPMNLTVPDPTVTTGPDYASQVSDDLVLVSNHNHSPGQGNLIPTNGIGINADLPFNSFNAVRLRSTRFNSQTNVLALGTDVDCIYVRQGDLYYNNAAGTPVQITSGGGLNLSAIGAFTGLNAPAAATYDFGTGTFTFTTAAFCKAAIACGPLSIATGVSGANSVTQHSPAGLAANYGLTFPSALPGSDSFRQVTSAGIESFIPPDNSTLTVTAGTLKVKNLGITAAQIAANAVTTAKILDANVTRPKLVAVGQQVSLSSGNWYKSGAVSTAFNNVKDGASGTNNIEVTVTSTGRPILLIVQADGSANPAEISAQSTVNNQISTYARWKVVVSGDDTADIMYSQIGTSGGPAPAAVTETMTTPGASYLYVQPAAGTYTFTLQAQAVNSTDIVFFRYCKLVAYEL